MDMSTPRRNYNLRSAERSEKGVAVSRFEFKNMTARNSSILLRKRNSATEDRSCHKRQRTHQSRGPPFSSPDSINQQKIAVIDEQRAILSLPRVLVPLDSPFGSLGKLPRDAIQHLLDRTPYTVLGRMAMTSTSWNETVRSYVKSGSFRIRWLADIEYAQDSIYEKLDCDPFFSMGVLTRFITVNDAWDTRIDFLKSFLTLAYEAGSSVGGLGKMIHAFSRRPHDEIVLEQIDSIVNMVFSVVNNLKDELSAVMVIPDVNRQLEGNENLDILYNEMKLRKKTLSLFLNNGSCDPSFGMNKYFLSCLMKVFKNLHGALPTPIFYLLFSPTTIHHNEEVIHWHRLSLVSVMSIEEAQELKQFSKALGGLLQCRNLSNAAPWTKNTVFNLMEEITTYPSPWSMSTFVSLHVLEPELVPIGVVARMNRNHEDEAGDMICTMKVLLHRWNMDVYGVMERVIDTVKSALKSFQRRILFDRCWNWHQRNIDELRDRFGPFSDIRAEIESQIEVMPVLMKLL